MNKENREQWNEHLRGGEDILCLDCGHFLDSLLFELGLWTVLPVDLDSICLWDYSIGPWLQFLPTLLCFTMLVLPLIPCCPRSVIQGPCGEHCHLDSGPTLPSACSQLSPPHPALDTDYSPFTRGQNQQHNNEVEYHSYRAFINPPGNSCM